MCFGLDKGLDYTNNTAIMLHANKTFPGNIKEILLYFCPYILFNLSAIVFIILRATVGGGSILIAVSGLTSVGGFTWLMLYSNYISPYGFDKVYILEQLVFVLKSWSFWYMLISLPL